MVEQCTRNAQVGGSSPPISSKNVMKYLFIYSTKAGKNDFNKFHREIKDFFIKKSLIENCQFVFTEDENHGRRVAKKFALENKEGIVYACGGDGTLSEIANVLKNTNIALGLIPMGTANDFSKIFDYENFTLDDLINPQIKKIDTIEINKTHTSINIASTGLDTKVLEYARQYAKKYKFLGKRIYDLATLKVLFNNRGQKIKMLIDEKIIEGTYTLCAFCNGSYYGGGFNPAPNSILNDGKMEIVLAEFLKVPEIIRLIPKYKKGQIFNEDKIKTFRAENVKIELPEEINLNIDGELLKDREFNLKLNKENLKFAILANLKNKNQIK